MLNENGIICIEIPDIESYKNEATTSDLLFFFEHQYHFTKDTIKIILERCGFKLLEFAKNKTHDFGMHFAAKKISPPKSENELNISSDVFLKVINEIRLYEKHFSNKLELLKTKVNELCSKNKIENKKMVFCPAGTYTKMILEFPEIKKDQIKFIIDNNSEKWGSEIFGIPIYPPTKLDSSIELIVIASSFSDELKKQLIDLGIDKEKIVIF